MTKARLSMAGAVLFFLALLVLASGSIVSQVLQSKIVSAVKESCPSCQLKIGEVHVSWLPSKIEMSAVEFQGDTSGGVILSFKLKRIEARFALFSFVRHRPHIWDIRVEQPRFKLVEKGTQTPRIGPAFPRVGEPLTNMPAMQVGGIEFGDGNLNYEYHTDGKVAVVDVHHIRGSVGGFATRIELLSKEFRHDLTINATAQLENSGSVKLKAAFDPYAVKNNDHIFCEVTGQNLSELDKFFYPRYGLTLKGDLKRAVASIDIRQGQMVGDLNGSYHDFSVKIHPTSTRGSFNSFIDNFFESLRTVKTRPSNQEDTPIAIKFSSKRRPYEAVTHLVARSLSAAAQKLITVG